MVLFITPPPPFKPPFPFPYPLPDLFSLNLQLLNNQLYKNSPHASNHSKSCSSLNTDRNCYADAILKFQYSSLRVRVLLSSGRVLFGC
jgi:hypothetical protein